MYQFKLYKFPQVTHKKGRVERKKPFKKSELEAVSCCMCVCTTSLRIRHRCYTIDVIFPLFCAQQGNSHDSKAPHAAPPIQ